MDGTEQKKEPTEIERKLAEARQNNAGEEIVSMEVSGFAGVFRSPTPEAWKAWKAERRRDDAKEAANQNLVVRCMVWPDHQALTAATKRKPAIIDKLADELVMLAGALDEVAVKKD